MATSSITPYYLPTIKTEPQEINDVDPMSYFDDDMTITELGPQSLIQRVKQEPREYTQLGCGATYNILAPMATTLTVAEPQSVIDHIKEEPREYTQLGCADITYNTLTPMATEYTQLSNYNPPPTHHPSQHHSPHPVHHNTDHVLMTPTEQNMPQEDKSKAKLKSKKMKREDVEGPELTEPPSSKKKVKQEKITDSFKVRKKVDRFGGVSEDEIIKKTLPDHLALDLDIIIIGINPGLFAAYKGHHYAGPGNHFWKCLFLAGLIPEPMTAMDDFKLIKHGIGFTNIVGRTTRGSADLKRLEIKEGAKVLLEKIQKYKPKIAAFNGKGIYEVFCGHKKFDIGKQPDPIPGTNTVVYVMPSSSARCAQLPRAIDKVPFYIALKKLRDYLCGLTSHLDESEVIFPDLKIAIKIEEDLENEAIKNEVIDGETKPEPAPKNPKKSKKKNQQPQQPIDTNYSGVTVKQENHNEYTMANSRSINMQPPFNQSYQNASGNQYPNMYNYSQHNYSYPHPQGMPDGSWLHNMPPFQNTIVPHQPLPGYNHHYDPGSFADQIPSIYKNQQSRQTQAQAPPPTAPSNFHQGSPPPPTQGAQVQPIKQTLQNQNSEMYGGLKIKQEHVDETYPTYEQGHYNINQT